MLSTEVRGQQREPGRAESRQGVMGRRNDGSQRGGGLKGLGERGREKKASPRPLPGPHAVCREKYVNEEVNNRIRRAIIKWDVSCYANSVAYGGIRRPRRRSVFWLPAATGKPGRQEARGGRRRGPLGSDAARWRGELSRLIAFREQFLPVRKPLLKLSN